MQLNQMIFISREFAKQKGIMKRSTQNLKQITRPKDAG